MQCSIKWLGRVQVRFELTLSSLPPYNEVFFDFHICQSVINHLQMFFEIHSRSVFRFTLISHHHSIYRKYYIWAMNLYILQTMFLRHQKNLVTYPSVYDNFFQHFISYSLLLPHLSLNSRISHFLNEWYTSFLNATLKITFSLSFYHSLLFRLWISLS